MIKRDKRNHSLNQHLIISLLYYNQKHFRNFKRKITEPLWRNSVAKGKLRKPGDAKEKEVRPWQLACVLMWIRQKEQKQKRELHSSQLSCDTLVQRGYQSKRKKKEGCFEGFDLCWIGFSDRSSSETNAHRQDAWERKKAENRHRDPLYCLLLPKKTRAAQWSNSNRVHSLKKKNTARRKRR